MTGDIFAYGPTPNEVLATLQQLPQARFLLGNTDRYLLERSYPASGGDQWQDRLLLSFRWTAETMEAQALRFLAGLPLSLTVQDRDWRLLAVHGSPRSDEEGIGAATSDDNFGSLGVDPRAVHLIACGHTHVPMDRIINGVRVVNAGSVGLPFDGDPRACYALISVARAEELSTRVELRRVSYDVEKVVEQFYAANHPAADVSAYNLRTAHSIGSSLIYTPEMRRGKPSQSAHAGSEETAQPSNGQSPVRLWQPA